MKILFCDSYNHTDTLVVLNIKEKKNINPLKSFPNILKNLNLTGSHNEKSTLVNIDGFSKIHILGAGKLQKKRSLRNIGGKIYDISKNDKSIQVSVAGLSKQDIAQIAYGFILGSYSFTKYKTVKNESAKLDKVSFVGENSSEAKKCFDNLNCIAQGVFLARDLVNEPANVLTPEKFVETAKGLSRLGVKVKILNEDELKKLGMNALLAVGQGSANKSYVAIMEYMGTKESENPFVFLGKGVTFDTGGISLKPSGGMEDMKFDMGGASAVIGAMKAISLRKAKANVIGVLGLVENMPDGLAQRPGDVVASMSGQTIEVINTDAEGRMVLADCLTYVQKKYKPRSIIDLATLTGAMMVALGQEYAGVFGNNDELKQNIINAGDSEVEGLWSMPMSKAYDKEINSNIADMKNTGSKWGGACTAAAFLGRFINDGTSWAHLDIAGMAWEYKGKPTTPKGGVGFGVRTLDRLVWDWERSVK
ncbi:MAG: leucyl aminopeptidase [Alphaproteobacteria bacterium]